MIPFSKHVLSICVVKSSLGGAVEVVKISDTYSFSQGASSQHSGLGDVLK